MSDGGVWSFIFGAWAGVIAVLAYFATVGLLIPYHEVGHCVSAWVQGSEQDCVVTYYYDYHEVGAYASARTTHTEPINHDYDHAIIYTVQYLVSAWVGMKTYFMLLRMWD